MLILKNKLLITIFFIFTQWVLKFLKKLEKNAFVCLTQIFKKYILIEHQLERWPSGRRRRS